MDQRVLGGSAVTAGTADPGAATSLRWSPPRPPAGLTGSTADREWTAPQFRIESGAPLLEVARG
jgi:hypothetical protein